MFVLALALACTVAWMDSRAAQPGSLLFFVNLPPGHPGVEDGRLLLMLAKDGRRGEPRFQIDTGANAQQIFGVDVEGWFTSLWDALTAVDPEDVLLGLGLQTLDTLLSAIAWLAILRAAYPRSGIEALPIVTAYAVAVAGNDVLPASLGTLVMLVMLISAAVYALSFLLIRALSRYRELAADRAGATLTGRPSALASALTKVTGDIARIPTRDLRAVQAFNAFFFTPAVSDRLSLATLLSTHPTLQQRLDQLAAISTELGEAAPGP